MQYILSLEIKLRLAIAFQAALNTRCAPFSNFCPEQSPHCLILEIFLGDESHYPVTVTEWMQLKISNTRIS